MSTLQEANRIINVKYQRSQSNHDTKCHPKVQLGWGNCCTQWTHNCTLIFVTIKPTRCTNFSNLFLEWKSTCFGQFLCPSSGILLCTHSNGICHTDCEQDQDSILIPFQAVCKTVRHIPFLCVPWKTPDDGQRNCPKHVEFHSKNKLEKLVHLVGFIIQM